MNDGITTSSKGRPLIGITTRLDLARDTFYLRRYYAEAIAANGGIPVYIPLVPDQDALGALAERLGGILLAGSDSDLDPVLYGAEPHPGLGPVVVERDTVDLALLEYAETHRVPVLGICFGLQSLNVSRGGTLIQDLGAEVPGSLKHEQEPPYGQPSHTIEIEPGSRLERLAGCRRVPVNSTHHQAIRREGKNLRVVARALDGVIEAVEDPRDDRFVLGVQWLPEFGWEEDSLSKAIFAAFMDEARGHRQW